MTKVFKLILLLFALMCIMSCGSKKSPTGGPIDTVKPEVVSIIPQEYSQLTDSIEITFSKDMDRHSFTDGLYFYPPIINKKVSYSARTLNIKILEPLKADCVYHLTLGTGVKDLRLNSMNKPSSFVFFSGKPSRNRISGNVIYEDAKDAGKPFITSMFSVDSLLVLNQEFMGGSYLLDALNPANYIMRAYADLDQNGRYDYGREPFFEQKVDLHQSKSLDIKLAYADSSKTIIRNVRPISKTELEVSLSKIPSSLGEIKIVDPTGNNLELRFSELTQNQLTLITAQQDTLEYRLYIKDLKDAKGNVNNESSLAFSGSKVHDDRKPMIKGSTPRNGTSINNLQPILEIYFDEIIPKNHLKLKLIATDSQNEIALKVLEADSRTCKVQAKQTLTNYRSYSLIILQETSDSAGNKLSEEHRINFMPLIPAQSP